MTLNLPKLPWVKVRTHLHVISNLCEIGTSIDSTLKDINQTHFSLFLSVTLPLPNDRWSTCVNQIRFDKWMIDCVDRKENPECCHIGCFSLVSPGPILGRQVGTNSYSVELHVLTLRGNLSTTYPDWVFNLFLNKLLRLSKYFTNWKQLFLYNILILFHVLESAKLMKCI